MGQRLMSLVLRDYQGEVREHLRDAFKRYRSVILQMPTGSGKTGVAAAVAEGLAKNGRSMLALVHRRELVDQFCETLEQVGLHGRYGVIASGRAPTPWAKFQVASIQTLYRRESLGFTPSIPCGGRVPPRQSQDVGERSEAVSPTPRFWDSPPPRPGWTGSPSGSTLRRSLRGLLSNGSQPMAGWPLSP